MIFFEADENKKVVLFILVGVFLLFIVSQWIKYKPTRRSASDNATKLYWTEFEQRFSGTKESFENNFEIAEIQFNNIKEEAEQEIRQEVLLENVKEYLEKKKNSTSSNATSTE